MPSSKVHKIDVIGELRDTIPNGWAVLCVQACSEAYMIELKAIATVVEKLK
jgi:hypothetical protein